ncbi:enoyl-CoA hydratase/isomerase family protein [Streptomyces sp. KK5PA1]|uniref:3-hydroxyisobutyryl-CoA hydrolase n=2 Tax=Actinacidiphila acididurans TaxID=2784346 RepID=A0ABS2TZ40_9ACTN|nr:enoyl-CoA hydratase/isomerase family protein [Actinacidiphila acididurans]
MAGAAGGRFVRARAAHGAGVIALDRPAALNALDLEMVRELTATLEDWRSDPGVWTVVVRSTSPKAFCAGGDIRAMREAGMRGDDAAVTAYFSAEYALDALIAGYPKPFVALIDGYAMGGGLGISVHGSARVVTERAVLAMPETSIGFFPDIGASFFLPRLPGGLGMYLGLTGVRISGAAAVECGLATHYVPAADLPALERALTGPGAGDWDPELLLDRFAVVPPPSELAGRRAAVDRCFGPDVPDLAAVRARLAAEEQHREWAADTLAALDAASPMSLAATFDLLRAGAGAQLWECLDRELALARRVARDPDFHEGVRAALVDKDRAPRWPSRPATAI